MSQTIRFIVDPITLTFSFSGGFSTVVGKQQTKQYKTLDRMRYLRNLKLIFINIIFTIIRKCCLCYTLSMLNVMYQSIARKMPNCALRCCGKQFIYR